MYLTWEMAELDTSASVMQCPRKKRICLDMIYGAKPKPDLLQCAGSTALWSEWRKFSLHHKLPSGVGRRQRTHFASIFPLQFKDKHHGLKNIAVKIDTEKNCVKTCETKWETLQWNRYLLKCDMAKANKCKKFCWKCWKSWLSMSP